MKKWIVYCTTCTVNNKIYIGVHGTENPNVFDSYLGCGVSKKNLLSTLRDPQTLFHRALKKHGYKNFTRNTLYVFDNDEDAYKKEAEIVTLDFIKRRDTYNTKIGGIHGSTYKPIYQYDLNGNFIKKWDGTAFAVEYYGCNVARFRMATEGKYSAFESYWTKEYVEHLDITGYRKVRASEIYQFDINGNLLNTYNHVPEVMEELQLSKASVDEAIQKSKMIKGFYLIKNKNDIWGIIKSDIDGKTVKPISRYSSDGTLIKTYLNITICQKELGYDRHDLKKAILSGKLYKGSLWSHYTTPTFIKYEPTACDKKCRVAQYDLEGNLIKIWNTVTECAKEHPKCREVLKGFRNMTHGFKFKYIEE